MKSSILYMRDDALPEMIMLPGAFADASVVVNALLVTASKRPFSKYHHFTLRYPRVLAQISSPGRSVT